MTLNRRTFVQSLGLCLGGAAIAPAFGQARFPSKPITIVVASAPGGQSDLIARYLAAEVGRELGQPILVDNRAGASGIVGLQHAARQPADGYTLAYGVGSWMAVNPGFFPNLPYDPVKDFVPITQIGITPQCLMLGAHVPANNLAELIALAKKSPGKLNYASFGNGSTSHLQGEMLKMAAGIDMVHVPFKGSAPALAEVIAGRVDLMIIDFAPALAFIKDGKLKPLAVTGTTRYPDFPQVPTFVELGYPLTLVGWNGLFAPAGTPADVVQLLNTEIGKVLALPDTRRRAEEAGTGVETMSPAQLGEFTRKELAYWGQVIKGSKITAD